MSHVKYSPKAQEDIANIWDYTAENWGLDQADRYVDDIEATCSLLAKGLQRGRTVDIREGYFKRAVGKHFVFFRMMDAEAGIVVIRVLHQRMDTNLHL